METGVCRQHYSMNNLYFVMLLTVFATAVQGGLPFWSFIKMFHVVQQCKPAFSSTSMLSLNLTVTKLVWMSSLFSVSGVRLAQDKV